ncbi:MAG: M48 family metalloprotease [Chloroflexi bacterium]|nr:M48 family metalloprotease [Chloroflexota bacterium]
MKKTRRTLAFDILLVTAFLLIAAVVVSASRAISAGCPHGWHGDIVCFLWPTHTDIAPHLLSYLLIGVALTGLFRAFWSWRQQMSMTALATGGLCLSSARDSRLDPMLVRLGLQDRVSLLDSEPVLCFCSGLTRPRIYISHSLVQKLTPEELEATLLHEKHHVENHDPLKILVGRIIVAALFFIPTLKDIFERYSLDKEVAADIRAVRHQGHRRGVAGALQTLLEERADNVQGAVAGVQEALSYRIANLTGQKLPFRLPRRRLVASFAIMGLLALIITVPLPGSHPEELIALIGDGLCSS